MAVACACMTPTLRGAVARPYRPAVSLLREADATADAGHIRPVRYGASLTDQNKVIVCDPCNHDKGHLTLTDWARKLRRLTTLAVEALLDGEAEGLTRKAIELANAGDIAALRMCLDRIAPARKDRLVQVAIPALNSAADAVRASAAIMAALSAGELTPSEAAELGKLVSSYVTALSASNLEKRLAQLEAAAAA